MDEYHVLPNNDLIDHVSPGDDCPCGPDVKFEGGGQVIIHHSLDGRELKRSLGRNLLAHSLKRRFLEGE